MLPHALALVLAPALLLAPVTGAAQSFTIEDPENVEPDKAAAESAEDERDGRGLFQSTLFKGSWTSSAAFDTGHEDRCSPRSCEDVFDLRNRLDLRLQADITSTLRAVLEARMSHYVVGERPEGETFTFTNAQRVKGHYEPDVREAFVRWKNGGWDVTVGNQVIAWGVLDTLAPQDVISPVDYRSGLSGDREPPRLPIFAVRAGGPVGPLALDAVVTPFFAQHRASLFGSDFAPLSVGTGAGFGGDAMGLLMTFIDESREDDWQQNLQATQVPQDLPSGASAGLRVGMSGGGIDAHVAWISGWDRMPMFEQTGELSSVILSGEIPFRSYYERQHVLGVDLSFVLGDFVVRAETGWASSRSLYRAERTVQLDLVGQPDAGVPSVVALRSFRKPTVTGGVGLDWVRDTDLAVGLEGFIFRVLDLDDALETTEEDGPDGRKRRTERQLELLEEQMIGVTGVATARFLDDDLVLTAMALFFVNDGSFALMPEVSYKLSDVQQLAGALQLYAGDAGSLLGRFGHNDQVVLRYTATF